MNCGLFLWFGASYIDKHSGRCLSLVEPGKRVEGRVGPKIFGFTFFVGHNCKGLAVKVLPRLEQCISRSAMGLRRLLDECIRAPRTELRARGAQPS
jgi:hypothetical protein